MEVGIWIEFFDNETNLILMDKPWPCVPRVGEYVWIHEKFMKVEKVAYEGATKGIPSVFNVHVYLA